PAWATFKAEVGAFLEPDRRRWTSDDPSTEPLSPRELDVLRLLAEGRTNDEIAAALTLSPRTIERHLSNIYLKLGVTGPAARTAAVARDLRERWALRVRRPAVGRTGSLCAPATGRWWGGPADCEASRFPAATALPRVVFDRTSVVRARETSH